jgi:hypothetical protein
MSQQLWSKERDMYELSSVILHWGGSVFESQLHNQRLDWGCTMTVSDTTHSFDTNPYSPIILCSDTPTVEFLDSIIQ